METTNDNTRISNGNTAVGRRNCSIATAAAVDERTNTRRETRASKKQRLLDEFPQVPAGAIADWIVPYANRVTCNNLSLTKREIRNEMQRAIWPWPTDVFKKVGRGDNNVTISSNGQWLVTVSDSTHSIKIWNSQSNKESPEMTVRDVQTARGRHGPEALFSQVQCYSRLLFSPINPNQLIFFSQYEGTLCAWDITDKKSSSSTTTMVLPPASSKCHLVWRMHANDVSIFMTTALAYVDNRRFQIEISPNGKWIAMSTLALEDNERHNFIRVYIICTRTQQVKCLLKSRHTFSHGRAVCNIKFCPCLADVHGGDGSGVSSASRLDDDNISQASNDTTSFDLIACASPNETFHVWKLNDEMISMASGATINAETNANEGGGNAGDQRSHNNQSIPAIKPNSIANPTDRATLQRNDGQTNVEDILFSNMIVFKRDGQLYVCTMNMRRMFRIYAFPQFTMACFRRLGRAMDTFCFENLAVSPDGTLLVSASLTTPRIQLLSTKDLSTIHTMYGLFPKRIRSLEFSPNDGSCIIASGNNGKVFFWDVSQFYDKKEKKPEYWDARVYK